MIIVSGVETYLEALVWVAVVWVTFLVIFGGRFLLAWWRFLRGQR